MVDIPENIKSIGSAAFSGCASLAEVRLPWGLEALGERAFAEAPALARVVVPNTVDAESFARAFDHETTQCLWLYEMDGDALIGYNGGEARVIIPEMLGARYIGGFAGSASLEAVTLPQSALEVSANGFAGCANLSEIDLNDGLTALGAGALADCAALEAIRLPASLETIGDGALAGLTRLEQIDLTDNDHFTMLDGALYDAAMTHLLLALPGRTGTLAVPRASRASTAVPWRDRRA